MHSLLSRSNALFTCTVTSLGIAMFFCFLSTAFVKESASTELNVGRALVDSVDDYTLNVNHNNDLGLVFIDLAVIIYNF